MLPIALLPSLLVAAQEAPAAAAPATAAHSTGAHSTGAHSTGAPAEDPRRQFDFWVGEWSVLNRHIEADGTWRVGDTTRARITPVCGGDAILEEWAGPFRGTFMNGFSLRAYDPESKDWRLLLFWTTDGNGGFGTLRGSFRHGRGEFFDRPPGEVRTRYSFSDALPGSIRWDSATTKDGGRTWATDWIMEFTRTRPAHEVTQDELFRSAWTEGTVSPYQEARRLDWMLGEWTGVQETDDGRELEARLRCKRLAKDCLVLDVLETRADADEDWHERLAVRGYEARPRAWSAWTIAEGDRIVGPSRGRVENGAVLFERTDPDGTKVTETLEREGDDVLRLLVMRVAPSGATTMTGTTLERAK